MVMIFSHEYQSKQQPGNRTWWNQKNIYLFIYLFYPKGASKLAGHTTKQTTNNFRRGSLCSLILRFSVISITLALFLALPYKNLDKTPQRKPHQGVTNSHNSLNINKPQHCPLSPSESP
jgi:hypothetical protein